MGIYMGPIWATHKGLMRNLQHGSMLAHMGKALWELYGSSMGKNHPTFIFQKKKQRLLHIFTQMIINPKSQPI